jgi:hypothetical protein
MKKGGSACEPPLSFRPPAQRASAALFWRNYRAGMPLSTIFAHSETP